VAGGEEGGAGSGGGGGGGQGGGAAITEAVEVDGVMVPAHEMLTLLEDSRGIDAGFGCT
jgi:hypothetical protein